MTLRNGGRAKGGARSKASASLDSQLSRQISTSFASQSSVEGYVDTVVDDQYVVIEASPSGSGYSSQSSQPVMIGEGRAGLTLPAYCGLYQPTIIRKEHGVFHMNQSSKSYYPNN